MSIKELKKLLRKNFKVYRRGDHRVFFFEFFNDYPKIGNKYNLEQRRTTYQYLGLIYRCKLEEEFQFWLEEKLLICM
jgi:hypothetical protein